MSGASRRRGGRVAADDVSQSDTSSRRGGHLAPPGAFDGPASGGSASAPGSAAGRRPSNAPSVTSGTQSPGASPHPAQGGFGPGSRPGSRSASVTGAPAAMVDPAKDPAIVPRYTDSLRNIDLPASFYNVDHLYALPTDFKKRPTFNTTGKEVKLNLNSYRVSQFPQTKIWQYDVLIGSGAEKRVVIRKVWESEARKKETGPGFLFDGNKLAWSMKEIKAQTSMMIDLDQEQGRRPGKTPNNFRLVIKKAKVLDVSVIRSYLEGRVQMGVEVLEAINFHDHLLRETPSTNNRFIPIKRQFYIRDGQRSNLGGGVEVFRGVYQSLRLAQGERDKKPDGKLVVNLDVANCCFWQPTSLTGAIIAKNNLRDVQNIVANCKPVAQNGHRQASLFQKVMAKNFRKLIVFANYKGNPFPTKEWMIKDFKVENAKEYMIDYKDNGVFVQKMSIVDYFKKKYNLIIQYPNLPLVEMTKKDVLYPMEFLHLKENQRYPFKLDEKQTAAMIKFAVAPPSIRMNAINEGKGWLNWSGDKVLNAFGLKIDPNMIKTTARLLASPGVGFGGSLEQPGYKGRWDLRGKKFLTGNPLELAAWGIGVFDNGRIKADKGAIDKFVQDFIKAYRLHGGKVNNAPPNIMKLPNDPAQAVEALHQSTGNKFQRRPQLLIFLVQDKNSFHYTRIKKSCDCRYGVVSQVMQLAQVLKGNGQYYSNVLMKVNAKLGGCTSQAKPSPSSGFARGFTQPTMIIGADVSHASPGSPQASMAALTVSIDRHGGRYAAACETNGHRVEMISEANFRGMLGPLVTNWMSTTGGGKLPTQVYYFRDGVSEGQFIHVMQQEVPHIKAVLSKAGNSTWAGKITVVIAAKRHHIRAFPDPGAADTKGNPYPGVLIERDCTSPFEWDFFLYSHIALQGTSRPVHYTVLLDEANHHPNALQNMIYEHCYQYMRSTTSVSLFPAVYYAHLASNRARSHEDVPASEGPQGGPGFKLNQHQMSDPPDSEAKPLTPMFTVNNIGFAMWYI